MGWVFLLGMFHQIMSLESNFNIWVYITDWMSAQEAAETYRIPKSTLGDEIRWKSTQAVTIRKKLFSYKTCGKFVSKFSSYLSFSQ